MKIADERTKLFAIQTKFTYNVKKQANEMRKVGYATSHS